MTHEPHACPHISDEEIVAMVATIRSGEGLSSAMGDPISRLHLAVVRYVNGLGPGDVEDEFDRVCAATGVVR